MPVSLVLFRFPLVFVGCSAGAGVRFCGKLLFTSDLPYGDGMQAQGIELGPFGGRPEGPWPAYRRLINPTNHGWEADWGTSAILNLENLEARPWARPGDGLRAHPKRVGLPPLRKPWSRVASTPHTC